MRRTSAWASHYVLAALTMASGCGAGAIHADPRADDPPPIEETEAEASEAGPTDVTGGGDPSAEAAGRSGADAEEPWVCDATSYVRWVEDAESAWRVAPDDDDDALDPGVVMDWTERVIETTFRLHIGALIRAACGLPDQVPEIVSLRDRASTLVDEVLRRLEAGEPFDAEDTDRRLQPILIATTDAVRDARGALDDVAERSIGTRCERRATVEAARWRERARVLREGFAQQDRAAMFGESWAATEAQLDEMRADANAADEIAWTLLLDPPRARDHLRALRNHRRHDEWASALAALAVICAEEPLETPLPSPEDVRRPYSSSRTR